MMVMMVMTMMMVLLLLYLATAILVELIDDSVNFVFVRILTSSSERLVQLLMGTIVMMMMMMAMLMITFVVRITVAKDVAYLCGDVTILIVVKVIKCLTVPYYKTIYVFASSNIIHHLIKHIICSHRSMSSAGKPGMPVLGAMLLLKLVIMINIMPSSRPARIAELPRSKFDPELFPHSAYVEIFVTFATKVPYLTFCNKM